MFGKAGAGAGAGADAGAAVPAGSFGPGGGGPGGGTYCCGACRVLSAGTTPSLPLVARDAWYVGGGGGKSSLISVTARSDGK